MYRSTTILYRMAEAFFRNRRLFLVAFLVVSAVTMSALYFRSKTFEATALTQVVTEDVAATLGEQQSSSWVSPAQQQVDQLNVLLNGNFLSAALADAHLVRPINTDPRGDDPRMALLRKKLTATVMSDKLFAISLTWDNPQDTEEIVRSVQNQYIQEIGQERYAHADAALAFLDSQIRDCSTQLRQSEQLLTAYKNANPGESADSQSADVSELSALQGQLESLQTTAQDNTAKKAALQQRLTEIKPLSVAEQMATASPLQVEINQLKTQRDALLVDKLPTHPMVVALTGKIAALEREQQQKLGAGGSEAQNITQTKLQDNPEWQEINQQIVQANIDQQQQTLDMAHLRQQIAAYQTRVKQIPDEQRTLTDKTRSYKVLQAQYDTLLQRREQVQMEGNLARVSASSSLSPIGYIRAEATTGRSKLIAMFFGSLVLGVIVGLTLIVLCEWADHSLRYGADTERVLGVPVLAIVPEAVQLRAVLIGDGHAGGGLQKALRAPTIKSNAKKDTAQENAPVALEAAAPVMSVSAMEGVQ